MGLIKTALKTAVAVKTAHVVHDRIQNRKQEQWVAQGHPAETFPRPPADAPPAQPAAPMADVLEQLRALADLKTNGVLSEAEFEAQKQRILAQ
jgi:hypothetical protein